MTIVPARRIHPPLGLYDLCRGFSALSIETRSRPRLLAATYRGFAFYVADPISSIRELASGRQARESPSDLLPSPFGDGVAAFVEFDVVDEGLDGFTR